LALSVETGLSRNFINEMEQGQRGASFQTIARLSFTLRVPAQQFFESANTAAVDYRQFLVQPYHNESGVRS
jgi:transcriptional regulator with XRE-family HTH domain